jgi:hypothetical protein
MPDTLPIVGFVGFCEKVWERMHGGEWEEGIGRWCSEGPQGMVRAQDREDSGSYRCS